MTYYVTYNKDGSIYEIDEIDKTREEVKAKIKETIAEGTSRFITFEIIDDKKTIKLVKYCLDLIKDYQKLCRGFKDEENYLDAMQRIQDILSDFV